MTLPARPSVRRDPDLRNEHEERARAVKAFKLMRVAARMIEASEVLDLAAFETAPDGIRRRMAGVAGVREPSEQTWLTMIEMLREELAAR